MGDTKVGKAVKAGAKAVGSVVKKAAVSTVKGYLKGTNAAASKIKKHLPAPVRAPRRSPRRPQRRAL